MNEKNLTKIFKIFGEEKYSKKIAREIVKNRVNMTIKTEDLVEIIDNIKKYHNRRIHNSTKVFQALRMLVNNEVSELINALIHAFNIIPVGGIIAVVTFHSIEDKIVKFFFKNYSEEKNSSRYLPDENKSEKCFKLINKKPILPSISEVKKNPPSRSAKLRYGIKVKNNCEFGDLRKKFKYLTDIEELR